MSPPQMAPSSRDHAYLTVTPPPSRSHPELALVLGSCLAVFAIVAIVSYLLMRERESVEQSAVRSANNIVQLIESDILRNV